jgi:WD40 repeat protein
VLVFSLQESSSDHPLAILNEHTFGVRAVAFSPDSRYLASLGTMNDGFLYIWAINVKTGTTRLHSSNKCTSFIKDIAWMGNNLIT